LGNQCHGDQAQRFDLRFFRPFRADLSIRKSSSFFPPLIAATSQRGLAPLPAQVHYGETIIREFPEVPRHVRRGFIRLYIVVAIPWIAWFGYEAYGDEDEGWGAILWLLVVPVGALILYFVVLWIAAGFRKRAEDKADQT
jgi:hypothetical protein